MEKTIDELIVDVLNRYPDVVRVVEITRQVSRGPDREPRFQWSCTITAMKFGKSGRPIQGTDDTSAYDETPEGAVKRTIAYMDYKNKITI